MNHNIKHLKHFFLSAVIYMILLKNTDTHLCKWHHWKPRWPNGATSRMQDL